MGKHVCIVNCDSDIKIVFVDHVGVVDTTEVDQIILGHARVENLFGQVFEDFFLNAADEFKVLQRNAASVLVLTILLLVLQPATC